MPNVSYYRGRPADFWIAVMSGAARPTLANPAPATSLASSQPTAPATQRRTPQQPSARQQRLQALAPWTRAEVAD